MHTLQKISLGTIHMEKSSINIHYMVCSARTLNTRNRNCCVIKGSNKSTVVTKAVANENVGCFGFFLSHLFTDEWKKRQFVLVCY